MRALGGRAPERPRPGAWPAVSVVVPAYRESRVIASKVRDVLDNDYPGTVEVVVVPEDEETAAAASETPATVVPFVERTGKAGALNRGVAAAAHEVVVLTDANARFSPRALERLVAWLDDPAFGAAGARKLVDGEGLYWRFEDWLKRAEMRHGSSIALDGAVLALRRAEYRPIPEDVVVDDLWLALDVVERGQAIAYDHEVVCEEEGFPALRDDWERRTRIVAGNVDALWRRRDRLRPGANGAFQLWGHRAVRSSVGPVSHLTLLLLCLGRSARSRSSRRFVVLHAVLGALAGGARVRRHASRPERLAYQVLFLQAVGLGGTYRFLRGDRPSRWDKQERVPMSLDVD